MPLGLGDMRSQRRRASSGDSHAPFWRGGSCFREDVLEELRRQTQSETIGADLELITMGIYASFGREHDLGAALMSARGYIYMYIYGRIESNVTYTGIVHEYVKSLLSCEEGFHAWLYCRQVREVNIHEFEAAETLRKGRLDAEN